MRKSILKNRLIIFALITMGIFFVDVKGVEANNLDWTGVTIECIYEDGGLYESSYNYTAKERIVNRYTYNLKGVEKEQTNTNSTINYVNPGGVGSSLPDHSAINGEGKSYRTCYDYVNVATDVEKNDEGEKVPVVYATFSSSSIGSFDIDNPNRGWVAKLFGAAKKKTLYPKSYKLVSENIVLTSKSGSPNKVFTYKVNNVGSYEQVVSDPNTISFLVYDNAVLVQGSSKINYIEKDGTIAEIANIGYNSSTGEVLGDPPQYLTLSDPEPKVSVGDGANVTYYFDSIRYEKTTSGGNRYEYYGTSSTPEPFDNGDLCVKVMPNTAKILAKVIGWCQLLVPALLIILVSIDLGKLMLSGNLDEELPKQKKRIVTRFIAAVFVFFLPFIMRLALTRVKVSGSSIDEIDSIEYIDCIFEMVGIS